MSVFFSLQIKASTMFLKLCILQVKLDHIEVTMFSLFPHFMISASYAVKVIQTGTQCNNTENVQSANPVGKEQRRTITNINQVIIKVLQLMMCLGTQKQNASKLTNNAMQCNALASSSAFCSAIAGLCISQVLQMTDNPKSWI